MLPPAAAVATVVVARFLWILIVVGAGLLLASVFGLVSAAPRFRRVAFVTAFVVCGLVTLLFGGGFYYFWYGWGHQVVDFQLSLALTTVGILALAAAVSPNAWLGGDKAEQRRQFGLRSLLVLAGLGFALGLLFSRADSYSLRSILNTVFWLCPACVPAGLWSSSTVAIPAALLNSIFFAAFGGVAGTLFGILFGSKAPIAITIPVVLATVLVWRNVFQHPPVRKPTLCESFVAGIAMDFRYPKLCNRIPFEAAEGVFVGGKEVDVTSLRSKCYLKIAQSTGDDSLCYEVKPFRGYGPFGGDSGCADQVLHSTGSWGQRSFFLSEDQLAPLMRGLGYTDQTLADANISPQNNSAWTQYIDTLRPPPPLPGINTSANPQERATLDFLNRLMNLHCKSE
jgi:hypothetical protein